MKIVAEQNINSTQLTPWLVSNNMILICGDYIISLPINFVSFCNMWLQELKSVPPMKMEEMEENEDEEKHKFLNVDCNEEGEASKIESPCQCSVKDMEYSPEQTIKEPLSAPFWFSFCWLCLNDLLSLCRSLIAISYKV